MTRVDDETQAWYARYYAAKGVDRNDPLVNPSVVMQTVASDRAFLVALGRIPHLSRQDVLDVGCASGSGLTFFLRYGVSLDRLHGIDIMEDRVAGAHARLPGVDVRHGDAATMPYPDRAFGIVTASTMFVQLTDDMIAQRIANEMLRVLRPSGHVLISDWRYDGGRSVMRAMDSRRIARLFGVGERTTLVASVNGALVPPIGRPLSRFAPWAYFLVASFLPFLVGLRVTVLRKTDT